MEVSWLFLALKLQQLVGNPSRVFSLLFAMVVYVPSAMNTPLKKCVHYHIGSFVSQNHVYVGIE